jgi:putative hydrolase of the HAD superfamily
LRGGFQGTVELSERRDIVPLDQFRVLSLFQRAVFSSDTRSVKPSLRLVREALAGVTCEAHEILMIGDSVRRDLLAGRRAGLAAAWVSAAVKVPPEDMDLVDYHVPSLLALVEGNDRRHYGR